MRRALRLTTTTLLLLVAGCAHEIPTSTVVLESRYGRELAVSTRFGIVAVGALQREGRLDVTAVYGDGPATELGSIEPISEELCRVQVPFETPWCEISTQGPQPGERLVLAGLDDTYTIWTEDVKVEVVKGAEGLLIAVPTGRPLPPGTGLYRWEYDRFRLVGLAAGKVTWKNRPWLVVHGPAQLSTFVTSYHDRGRKQPRSPYRRDVRPR